MVIECRHCGLLFFDDRYYRAHVNRVNAEKEKKKAEHEKRKQQELDLWGRTSQSEDDKGQQSTQGMT